MGSYEKFLHVISKWPVEAKRESLDFGFYLRTLVKKKDLNGNVFPGNTAENLKIIDSLLRMLNNTYKNKYPATDKKGASGLDVKSMEEILTSELVKEKSKLFKLSKK